MRFEPAAAALVLALGAGSTAAAPATPGAVTAPWTVVVEHRIELPPTRPGGQAPRELSALAWDPQRGELVAVSDRGRLFRYGLRSSAEGLRAEVLAPEPTKLTAPDGTDLDAEGLAWRPADAPGNAGEWLLAAETARAVFRLTAEGRPAGTSPWPSGLASAVAGGQRGVEAIGWHPRHGLLAAAQNTARTDAGNPGTARRLHTLHAASGSQWFFEASARRSHVKAIEVLADGSVLVLERVQAERNAPFETVLRWLDLGNCAPGTVCAVPSLEVSPPAAFGHDNQEGLACHESRRCWVVNDSGPDRQQPSRLTQFRLVPR